jgi:hypothetical protein
MVLLAAVLLTEFINATTGINHLLLTSEEGVAGGANLKTYVVARGRTGLERVTAATSYGDLIVIGMDIRFHVKPHRVVMRRYQSPRQAPR